MTVSIFQLMSAVMSRAVGSAGNLLLLFVVARFFGVSATGYIFSALSTAYITSYIFNIGLNRFTLKELSLLADQGPILRILKTLAIMLLVIQLVLGILVIAVAQLLGAGASLLWVYSLGFFLGSLIGFLLIISDILKSQGRTELGILFETSLLPWVGTTLVLLAAAFGHTSDRVPVSLLICSAVILCGAIVKTQVVGRFSLPNKRKMISASSFLNSKKLGLVTFWVSGLAVIVASRLPGVVAPLVTTPQGVGMIAACLGIASLGGTITHAIQSYFAPKLSHAASQENSIQQIKLLGASQVLCFSLFAMIAVPCFLWPREILAIFGTEFAVMDTSILYVMVGGQLIRALSGCSEIFLSMIGRAKSEAISLLIGIVIFCGIIIFGSSHAEGTILMAYAYASGLVVRGTLSTLTIYAHLLRRF